MIKILDMCLKNNKVGSFYFNKEDNQAHLTGYVCCYNENEILIKHITPRGEYDGFVLNRLEDMYRIDIDGDYEKKIESLYKLKKQSHVSLSKNTNDCIIFPLLDFSKENDFIITMELQDNSITGFIEAYDDMTILINVIDEFGHDNGKTSIEINEVVSFSCDTDYEQDLNILCKFLKSR